MLIKFGYYLDNKILKKSKGKINVVVMEPVRFYREMMVQVLNEFLTDRVKIIDVVSSLSELTWITLHKGPADIYLMEAFGMNENYQNWSDFTHFMSTYYPGTKCLIWSNKPTMFLKKLKSFEDENTCWQIPKRISVECFVCFLNKVLNGGVLTPAHSCIGPPMSNLTIREIDIITEIIEGKSINSLARKYKIGYKTVSTHKRNAMIKMRISTISQLRSLFIEGCILRGEKARSLPIELNVSQPFLL